MYIILILHMYYVRFKLKTNIGITLPGICLSVFLSGSFFPSFLVSRDMYVRGANVIALQSASVAWTKNLTLATTSKPKVIDLSYFICVFLVTRPFTWYHNFWPSNLDLEVWPTFEKLNNLGHNFKTRCDRAFILHMCIPCDKTFHTVP